MNTQNKSISGKLIFLSVISLIIISACASKGIYIRASDNFVKNNDIQKVAIFAEGKVNWPRMGKDGNSIILNSSKESLINSLTLTKDLLASKGYDVVTSHPVGVGYNSKGWWLVDNSKEELDKKEIDDNRPVFLYPEFKEGPEMTTSVHNLIDALEQSVSQKQVSNFSPDIEDIEVIKKYTDADTICLLKTYGVKYSTGRKVGDFALGVLAAMFGASRASQSTDRVHLSYIFIDTDTKEVIWQHGEMTAADPINPSKDFVSKTLHYLPKVEEEMDSNACQKSENSLYKCNVVRQNVDESDY